MSRSRAGEGVDEELRRLVQSLDDLDAELAAGDLDPDDYETLRNDYTIRVAEAVRSAGSAAAPDSSRTSTSGSSGVGRWLVVAGLGVFAVGIGLLLARSTGERGIGDALTGSIDASARQLVADCQDIGVSDGDLLGAIQCFDDVLTTNPENVEALTYRAWFLVLASTGGAAPTDTAPDETPPVDTAEQETELLEAARIYLDQAIDIDPAYADARAFRAVVADRLGNSAEVCTQIEALVDSDPPPFFIDQTRALVERHGCGTG